MDCDICLEDFNREERVAKLVQCGHTVCLLCLQRSDRRQCPTCRRVFDVSPDALPNNFQLLQQLERPDSPRRRGPPPAAPGPAPPETRPEREMDVDDVSGTGPNERQQDKEALLAAAPGVTRLARVWCDEDPAWSLQLLQRAAPTLERLSVYHPREAHLRAVHDMPRLRRLAVHCNNAAAQLPQLPALPPGHAGLQWLRVCLLPRATTQSLLRAHGGTLEELELGVGTAGSDEWPRSCGDLHSLLQQTGLRALRRLVLLRRRAYSHEPAACSQQRAEVRRVLPGAEVLCGRCDRVREEEV